MKKKGALLLAVLLVVSLLTGCQSIMEGLVSGAAEVMDNKLDNMEPYLFCLDQRITFGMTMTEVEALMGTPQDTREENAGIGLWLNQYTYSWTYGEHEGTMMLMFLQNILYSVDVTVFCDEEEKAEILEAWKALVNETYGEMPGYSWTDMDFVQQTGAGTVAFFNALQTDHGVQGTIATHSGELSLACIAT